MNKLLKLGMALAIIVPALISCAPAVVPTDGVIINAFLTAVDVTVPSTANGTNWVFEVTVGDLFKSGVALKDNGGIDLCFLIDDNDNTSETKGAGNTYSHWGLPTLTLPAGFTPDYEIAIQAQNPKVATGLTSAWGDGSGKFNRIQWSRIAGGTAFSGGVLQINGLDDLVYCTADIETIATNGPNSANAYMSNGVVYITIPKASLPVENMKYLIFAWGAGTTAWGNNAGNPAGLVESLPLNASGLSVATVSGVVGTGIVGANFIGLPTTFQGVSGALLANPTITVNDDAGLTGISFKVSNKTAGGAATTVPLTGTGPYTAVLGLATLNPAHNDVLVFTYVDSNPVKTVTKEVTVKRWSAATIAVSPNGIFNVNGESATHTVTVTITDTDITNGMALVLTADDGINPQKVMSGAATAAGTFSGTFTFGNTNLSADFSYEEGENATITVSYNDGGGAETDTSLKPLNDAVGIQIDGYKDADWATALTIADTAGDWNDTWAIYFDTMYITNDGTSLLIAADLTPADNQWNQLELFIDYDNSAATGFTNLTPIPWGMLDNAQVLNFSTTTGMDFAFRSWDGVNYVAKTNNAAVLTPVIAKNSGNTFVEMSVPLATLGGVAPAATIKVVLARVNDWSGGCQIIDTVPNGTPGTFTNTTVVISTPLSYVIH